MTAEQSPPNLARISDYVTWYAARTPKSEALVLGPRRIDYAELARQVDALSRALLARGVRRGDRVATLSTPHPDFFTVFLATASIGAIWVGLNPRYRREELRYVLSDSRPSLVFTRSRIGARDYGADITALQDVSAHGRWVVLAGDTVPPDCLSYTEFIRGGTAITASALAAARDGVRTSDPALIVYTSGSTGRSKGALLPHRGLTLCCQVQHRHWGTLPLRTLNFFPINHIACVGDIACYTLVGGGCTIFLEQFSPAASLDLIASERVTLWAGVPTTFLLTMRDQAFSQAALHSVQRIIWSGAAASADLVDALVRLGKWVGTSYGLTETVGSMTYTDAEPSMQQLVESVGRPPAEYAVRIVAEEDRPVAPGNTGEVQIRGDFLMNGYWQRPDATAEAMSADGWFRTGDLGFWREDGNLALVGRRAEAFKSGGYNVYPREVEMVLERCHGVRLAAVVAVPDPLYGHVGHAFVVPEAGVILNALSLQHYCRQSLANYKVPKRISVVTDAPMLPIGKVDKRALATLAAEESATG